MLCKNFRANKRPKEFFSDGIPVEIGKIQRELKKLWQDSKTATRASRLNLVIYSAAEHSIRANTALVEKITREHALRAILISAKPQGPATASAPGSTLIARSPRAAPNSVAPSRSPSNSRATRGTSG